MRRSVRNHPPGRIEYCAQVHDCSFGALNDRFCEHKKPPVIGLVVRQHQGIFLTVSFGPYLDYIKHKYVFWVFTMYCGPERAVHSTTTYRW